MKIYIWIFALLFLQITHSSEKNAEKPETVSEKTGWTYIGSVYKNKWLKRHFDIEIPEFKTTPNEDLEYHYPEPKEIKVLAPVTLRENHLQFVNDQWVKAKLTGEICKDQMINIISLKRVAEMEGGEGELDGFYWAKVSGDIGRVCK